MQERERIDEWLRLRRQARQNHGARGLRGLGAIGMAAHAIEGGDQRGIGADRNRHAILVLFTGAEQADFGEFDLQKRSWVFG
jgi:hypothetical protein